MTRTASLLSSDYTVHSSTTDRYDRKYDDRIETLSRLADEGCSFFVCPIPAQGFFGLFSCQAPLFPRSSFQEDNVRYLNYTEL